MKCSWTHDGLGHIMNGTVVDVSDRDMMRGPGPSRSCFFFFFESDSRCLAEFARI